MGAAAFPCLLMFLPSLPTPEKRLKSEALPEERLVWGAEGGTDDHSCREGRPAYSWKVWDEKHTPFLRCSCRHAWCASELEYMAWGGWSMGRAKIRERGGETLPGDGHQK